MKVAILGFSTLRQSESLPVYRYFKRQGAEITVFYWGNPSLPSDITSKKISEGETITGLDDFDLIIRGPAVHPRQISSNKPVSSLTNLFVENCPSRNIIGVTGTKGKGTTSTLITKLLEAVGKKVWLGGNIGRPLLDDLENIHTDDWVVLEMSAGQLITFDQRVPIALCLMVVPEHLDWHKDIDDYLNAKKQLFAHQQPEDTAIYYEANELSRQIAATSPGKRIPYMAYPGAEVKDGHIIIQGQTICNVSELKLLGEHNWQNVCAAITTVWQVTHDVEAIKRVVTSFQGLPHRLEPVRTVDDITYYNDSFASAPGATLAAIKAIREMKVMIVGGFDRMLDLKEFANHIKANESTIRRILLIGASASRTGEALAAADFHNFELSEAKTMTEIVNQAKNLARSGDAVVLSPGFASFDMFKNFEDRGIQFKDTVISL